MKYAYFLLKTELDDNTSIDEVVKYVEDDVEMVCVDYMEAKEGSRASYGYPYIGYQLDRTNNMYNYMYYLLLYLHFT